jgi:hypothetical protein
MIGRVIGDGGGGGGWIIGGGVLGNRQSSRVWPVMQAIDLVRKLRPNGLQASQWISFLATARAPIWSGTKGASAGRSESNIC